MAESGGELLQLASLLVPHIDDRAERLRWPGKLLLSQAVQHLSAFFLELMADPRHQVPAMDEQPLGPLLKRFRPPPGTHIGGITEMSFEDIYHYDDPEAPDEFEEQISYAEKRRRSNIAQLEEEQEFLKQRGMRDYTEFQQQVAEEEHKKEKQRQRQQRKEAEKRQLAALLQEPSPKNGPPLPSITVDNPDEFEESVTSPMSPDGSFVPPPRRELTPSQKKIQQLLVTSCGPSHPPKKQKEALSNSMELTPAMLQEQCEGIISAIFAASDEQDCGHVAWEDVTGFLSDSAIAYSAQLALRDVVLFIQGERRHFGTRTCMFSQSLGEGKMLQLVLEASSNAVPEIQIVNVSTLDVVSRYRVNVAITSMEVVAHKNQAACCTELALLFFETRNWKEAGRLGLDVLGETASCAHWDTFQNRLLVGCRSGKVWIAEMPQWISRSSTWAPPRVVQSIEVAQASVLRMHSNVAEGLLFASTSRGQIHCYDSVSDASKHTMQCGNFGIHLVTSVAYNPYTQYLVCGGEAPFLLAWIAPALPNQPPIKIEDNVCPHASRVMGVASVPDSSIVASLDNRGIFKMWDLNTLQCTQTKKLPILQNDFVGLYAYPQRLVVSLQKECTVFSIDNEKLQMPVLALQQNPKGGAVGGVVNRDLIEWNVKNGRKSVHHQNLTESELIAMAYGGRTGTFSVLTRTGEVGTFSLATGKQLAFYDKKVMKGEAIGMQFCSINRRLIVPSVDKEVWFLPMQPSTSEYPVKAALAHGDTSCTCIAIGSIEGVPVYFVGTTENSVNCFIFRHPNSPKRLHRFALPEGEQTTAILYSDADTVICADTGGIIHLVRLPKYKIASQVHICDTDKGEKTKFYDRNRFVTCMASYIAGAVFLCGDDFGHVHILHFSKRHTPTLLVEWQASHDSIRHITVEQNIVFVTTESADMSAWTLEGKPLLHLWGPDRSTADISHASTTRPGWMAQVEERMARVKGTKIDMSSSFASPIMKMSRVVNRLRNVIGGAGAGGGITSPSSTGADSDPLSPVALHQGAESTASFGDIADMTASVAFHPDFGSVAEHSGGSFLKANASVANNSFTHLQFPSFVEEAAMEQSTLVPQQFIQGSKTQQDKPTFVMKEQRSSSIIVSEGSDSDDDAKAAEAQASFVARRKEHQRRLEEVRAEKAAIDAAAQLHTSTLPIIWKREEEKAATHPNEHSPSRRTVHCANHCLGLPPVSRAHDEDESGSADPFQRSRILSDASDDFNASKSQRALPRHAISMRKAPVVTRRSVANLKDMSKKASSSM